MPQSLSAVYVHAYLGGISLKLECAPIRVGGVEDHVHILARLGRNIAQKDWIKKLKRVSNGWIQSQPVAGLSEFSWQGGYACFSVSVSNLEAVTKYIDGQEAHHRKVSFQDELRMFLEKHGEAWDKKYLWD